MTESRHLQLLGTGAGDAKFGTPEAADLPLNDRRRFTCNHLTPDLLIDFNNHTRGALDEFGIDPTTIHNLLISHGHFDHFQPLEIIEFAATLPHPLNVFGNSMVIDTLELCRDTVYDSTSGRFAPRQGACNLTTTKLAVGTPVQLGSVGVTPLHGNHSMNKKYCIMEEQALNFLIKVGDRSIFYGLDSSYMMPRTLDWLAGTHLDIAIVDATFGPRVIDPAVSGHHNWVMLDETLDDLRGVGCINGDTVIVAAHLSVGNVGSHEPVALEQARKGITLAYDGLVLPL